MIFNTPSLGDLLASAPGELVFCLGLALLLLLLVDNNGGPHGRSRR